MSIYDDLANSDFMDPGKFREQLRQLAQVQESQETNQEGDHGQLNDAGGGNGEYGVQESGSNDLHMMKMNAESLKRQKIAQAPNPMDDENEQSLVRNTQPYHNAHKAPGLPQGGRVDK